MSILIHYFLSFISQSCYNIMGLQVVGVEDVLCCLSAIVLGMEDLSSLTRD